MDKANSALTSIFHRIGDHLMLFVLALLLCPVLVAFALLMGAPLEAGLFMWSIVVIIIFAVVYFKYRTWPLP